MYVTDGQKHIPSPRRNNPGIQWLEFEALEARVKALEARLGGAETPEVAPLGQVEAPEAPGLTVAELKDRLREAGIPIPRGASKADMIALLNVANDDGAAPASSEED